MSTPVLPNLATPDDVIARLGRNFNQVEAARVDAMLADGSAFIRNNAGNDFVYVEGHTMKLVADAGTIVIPNKPVVSIDAVIAVSGNAAVPNLPITWYLFDGIDQVLVPEPGRSGVINLADYWYDIQWSRQPFLVTHTHGYTSTPQDVLALLCSAIISELSTPTMSATIQGEQIGAYSYTMRRREVGGGIYAALLDFGMKDVLSIYRKKEGTIAVRYLCSQLAEW